MVFKYCLICKTKFFKPVVESKKAWEFRHKYCSRRCSYDAKKGTIGWARGLTIADPRIAKFREACRKATLGRVPWNKGLKGAQVAWNKGLKNPTWLKEGNPNWRGGVTPEHYKVRKSTKYKEWRVAVFERDNYTCQECGEKGGYLHADHIKPFALYLKLRFDLSNGRTLCIPCHRKTKTWGSGKLKVIEQKNANYGEVY